MLVDGCLHAYWQELAFCPTEPRWLRNLSRNPSRSGNLLECLAGYKGMTKEMKPNSIIFPRSFMIDVFVRSNMHSAERVALCVGPSHENLAPVVFASTHSTRMSKNFSSNSKQNRRPRAPCRMVNRSYQNQAACFFCRAVFRKRFRNCAPFWPGSSIEIPHLWPVCHVLVP